MRSEHDILKSVNRQKEGTFRFLTEVLHRQFLSFDIDPDLVVSHALFSHPLIPHRKQKHSPSDCLSQVVSLRSAHSSQITLSRPLLCALLVYNTSRLIVRGENGTDVPGGKQLSKLNDIRIRL